MTGLEIMAKKNKGSKSPREIADEAYRSVIADRIRSGEIGMEQLQDLESKENVEDEVGIPESLRIKRPYHMSEAAIKQRQDRRKKGGKVSAKTHPDKYEQLRINRAILELPLQNPDKTQTCYK